MAATTLDAEIRSLEQRLARAVDSHPPLTLSPAWWQARLLDWATNDPDFRTKLLRFVDVLPTLRNARSVADHVRQYFRGAGPGIIGAASGLASQPVFRPVLSRVVREGVFAMAARFIAGETPDQAANALRELARQGVAYTVDLLGEETLSDAEADTYLARYSELIEALSARPELSPHGEVWASVPPVNISVKLSALCAHLEPGAPDYVSETARSRLRPLFRLAKERGAFMNLDIEQYRYKDLAHRTLADLLTEPELADFEAAGIVVQAYTRDAEEDLTRLRSLAERRGAPFSVRLVKGAYWDEEHIVADQNNWPVPVWSRKADTDACYDRCTDALVAAYPHLRPAFGSHNPYSVAQAIAKWEVAGHDPAAIEIQTLFGMAEGLRTAVGEMGYRTRIYVPVGQVIPGMAYLVRRLLENTSNQAWFNAASSGDGRGPALGLPDELEPPPPREGAFVNAPPAPFFVPDVRQRMSQAIADARKNFGDSHLLLSGDRELSDREFAAITYPAEPETVIGTVAQATLADVGEAVAAGRDAFPGWRDTPATERADILRHAAGLLEERRYDLAALMVFESGKPWAEADDDVRETIDFLRYYADQAIELETPRTMGGVAGEHSDYFHRGRGVVAVIAPWNFPMALIGGMTAGALAGGNPAILKPAGESPIIAYHLVRALRDAGVPPAAIQYLPGRGSVVGQALIEHPGIDTVAFTGSSEVGLGIIESAAKSSRELLTAGDDARNVKRVIAEMGGKNAIIIDDDADLDQAVAGAVASAFAYAGQKCSACSRLIIVGSAYDEALTRLNAAVGSLVVGPPHDPATYVSPVISASARDTIQSYIDSARDYATLSAQASTPDSPGYFVRPTVFTGVPVDSPLAQEEIFGPVLAVFHAATFDEALGIAMNSPYALTGGVYSRNPRHIAFARRRFAVGNLYINRKITGAIPGRHPFGGSALSGIGEKAGGPDYVRQFMEPRAVTENTVRRGFAPEEEA
ncbi:MAG TPA: proline dehydrogenase family protein [Dehalococcoidia bacterium]|nr:proline dehydrogenase family protein [Dehalococcoidia bacterium]